MPDNPIEEIKNRLDIVDFISGYIKLQKAGRNYKAACPFHSETSPSFMVSPERQLWRCFGCNRGGSIFDFVMEMEGVEFGDALRILAQRAGIELKKTNPELAKQLNTERNRLYQICQLANQFFIKQLEAGQNGQAMKKYLAERGINQATIQEWEIGYAPQGWRSLKEFLNSRGYPDSEIEKAGLAIKSEKSNLANPYYDRFRDRIIFPITDINGQIVGFTGRENPNQPNQNMGKYINTPNTLIYDKSKIIYGLDKAKLAIRKNDGCILMEGQMDVIIARQEGFENAVASSGTAFSEQQLKTIKRYTNNLAMAFDMDLAGETATKKVIDLALAYGFNARVISLPAQKDPADLISQNKQKWQKAVKSAKHLMEYYLETALANSNPATAEGKKAIANQVLPMIKKISNQVEQAHWLQILSNRLQTPESALSQELAKIQENSVNLSPLNKPAELKNCIPLEEYFLGLLLIHPKQIKRCQKYSEAIFSNLNLQEIYKLLKKTQSVNQVKKQASPVCQKQIEDLAFKAEVQQELAEEFEPEKEIEFCLSQLHKRRLQGKLQELNKKIKQAEQENDKRLLEKLTKNFNQLLKQI